MYIVSSSETQKKMSPYKIRSHLLSAYRCLSGVQKCYFITGKVINTSMYIVSSSETQKKMSPYEIRSHLLFAYKCLLEVQ